MPGTKEYDYKIIITGTIKAESDESAFKRIGNAITMPLYMLRPGWEVEIEIEGKKRKKGCVDVNCVTSFSDFIDRGLQSLGQSLGKALAGKIEEQKGMTPDERKKKIESEIKMEIEKCEDDEKGNDGLVRRDDAKP